ncbi:actin-like ATPase domain-containing protein [Purpureocillium lavendulum]|uniref:Actin-like ATPase domain-containing protein n=1 Tax=Purpureocillium lavendulum TaxID=1247861 RepID=A0AB34G3U4_9HYPO|nr:actin-like ATPase domain-containing protein [Purpureocillium lavendulum]
MARNRLRKRDFAVHHDAAAHVVAVANADINPGAAATAAAAADDAAPDTSPARTLTPASTRTINSMPWRGSPSTTAKQALARSATIRSVPSFEGSESSPESKRSAFGSSVNSNTSGSSAMGASQHERTPPTVRLRSDAADAPVHWHANGVRAIDVAPAQNSSGPSEDQPADTSGQWDSTIGKAGLGKTGRVINKLVSDNDALKRDIQIERLRAEEAKQAAKLLEDKMERMMNEYEGRLLEANVTKTLLARKERQVETLTATVETEKKKAVSAIDRERSWREELERVRSETTAQVEEATGYAQLMEGRYNAISSHWRDQGDEVKRAVSKMKGDIDNIVEERRTDDDKIQTLRDLCEQQDCNIKQLTQDKERIARLFDEYKQTQEDDLRDIKANARKREMEQERLLDESREALAKLKWALNVKKNVKDAQ